MTDLITGEPSAILGTWHGVKLGQAQGDTYFTLRQDGTFTFNQINGSTVLDPSGHNGAETGTYSWNSASGSFSYNMLSDDNGEWGVYDGKNKPITNLTVIADTMTVKTLDGTFTVARVTSATDATGNGYFVGTSAVGTMSGLSGNDTFNAGAGDQLIDGKAGINTSIYRSAISLYSINKTSSGFTVSGGNDGTDTLTNIERLQFSDAKLALDLDGNAGLTVKILGAVFGAASVTNKQFVGIGLSILDGGMSYSDLMALALTASGATTNDAVVTTLWTNVIGTAPTAADKAPFVDMLNNGMKAGDLGVLAANTSLNTGHINLVGLLQSGIEYV